jgi:hypothetical protein
MLAMSLPDPCGCVGAGGEAQMPREREQETAELGSYYM